VRTCSPLRWEARAIDKSEYSERPVLTGTIHEALPTRAVQADDERELAITNCRRILRSIQEFKWFRTKCELIAIRKHFLRCHSRKRGANEADDAYQYESIKTSKPAEAWQFCCEY